MELWKQFSKGRLSDAETRAVLSEVLSSPATRTVAHAAVRILSDPASCEAVVDLGVGFLMRLLFSTDMYESSLRTSGVDLDKLPLESIDNSLIDKATVVLKDLEGVVARKLKIRGDPESVQAVSTFSFPRDEALMSADIPVLDKEIERLSQAFWDVIPMEQSKREPISDFKKLKESMDVLEEMRAILDSSAVPATADTWSSVFARPFKSVAADDSRKLTTALTRTHAGTHSGYRMIPQKIFDCTYDADVRRHKLKGYDTYTNRMLLWHGSSLANWPRILRHGLVVKPPNVTQTGSMFGNGIYFADMSSKSANYCKATRDVPYGVLALAEVALGVPYKRVQADYNAEFSCATNKGNHTWGVGRYRPRDSDKISMRSAIDGLTVLLNAGAPESNREVWEDACKNTSSWMPPCREGCSAPMSSPSSPPTFEKSPLIYNEFVVYDEAQVILRYAIIVQFQS